MSEAATLPDGDILTWYGDDFTGAAAVMEVLTFASLPSVLFFDTPTKAQLGRFPEARAIGVASTARTQSPERMEKHLSAALAALADLCDGIVHYKVCTTLDSSPTVGSIGKAIEVGADVVSSQFVPILITAPQMHRFQYFGHLFAGFGEEVYRLNRHPVMSHHPVTPISESDVAAYIGIQTSSVELRCINTETLFKTPDVAWEAIQRSDRTSLRGLTIDSTDAETETAAGALIWGSCDICRFVVGSQGVEYALIRHWQAEGYLPLVPPVDGTDAADVIAVVSGSVSQTTEEQISWSLNNGFACIRFDVLAVIHGEQALAEENQRVVVEAVASITSGQSPLTLTSSRTMS